MSALAFCLLLPAAVWLLGAVFALLDRGDRGAALARVAIRGLPFVAVAMVLGQRAALPALAAVVTALAAHVIWSWLALTLLQRGSLARRAPDDV